MTRTSALWIMVVVLAFVSGCSEAPNIAMARTAPVSEVLEMIYNRVLQFDPTNGYNLAQAALAREDLSGDDRVLLEFAGALTLENYKPKKDRNVNKAAEIFESIAKKSPELAPRALLHIARGNEVHLNKPRPDKAAKYYQRIIAEYPKSDAAKEAALRLGVNLIWRKDKESREKGRKLLEDYIKANPKHDITVSMHLVLADTAIARENYKAAVKNLIAAHDKGIIPYRRRMRAVYQIGNIAYLKLSDYDLAEKYYKIGVEKYWNWVGNFEAKERLAIIAAKKKAMPVGDVK